MLISSTKLLCPLLRTKRCSCSELALVFSNKKPIKRNNKYVVAFERIKHETNTHTCISCEKDFNYKLHNLYQQFGNCGGIDSELFVDCNCGCKNIVYISK